MYVVPYERILLQIAPFVASIIASLIIISIQTKKTKRFFFTSQAVNILSLASFHFLYGFQTLIDPRTPDEAFGVPAALIVIDWITSITFYLAMLFSVFAWLTVIIGKQNIGILPVISSMPVEIKKRKTVFIVLAVGMLFVIGVLAFFSCCRVGCQK